MTTSDSLFRIGPSSVEPRYGRFKIRREIAFLEITTTVVFICFFSPCSTGIVYRPLVA